jgi:hypothetical protein
MRGLEQQRLREWHIAEVGLRVRSWHLLRRLRWDRGRRWGRSRQSAISAILDQSSCTYRVNENVSAVDPLVLGGVREERRMRSSQVREVQAGSY